MFGIAYMFSREYFFWCCFTGLPLRLSHAWVTRNQLRSKGKKAALIQGEVAAAPIDGEDDDDESDSDSDAEIVDASDSDSDSEGDDVSPSDY